MSIGSVLIGLQASRADGRGVTSAEFLTPLKIRKGEVVGTRADGGAWASGMVYLSVIRLSEFAHIDTAADAGAQSEAFHTGVVEGFRVAARFLDGRPPKTLDGIRNAGVRLRLFVDVRMDQDQMEVELPSELMSACGRHGLGMYLISNDIAAG